MTYEASVGMYHVAGPTSTVTKMHLEPSPIKEHDTRIGILPTSMTMII